MSEDEGYEALMGVTKAIIDSKKKKTMSKPDKQSATPKSLSELVVGQHNEPETEVL